MIETLRGSDILLEIRLWKKGERQTANHPQRATAEKTIGILREKIPSDYLDVPRRIHLKEGELEPSQGFTHLLVIPKTGIPAFALHKAAGGVKRYFLVGHSPRKVVEEIVHELQSLEFEIYIIADLLEITGCYTHINPWHDLQYLEKKYGTRRVFSGDFPVVTLAHAASRNKK